MAKVKLVSLRRCNYLVLEEWATSYQLSPDLPISYLISFPTRVIHVSRASCTQARRLRVQGALRQSTSRRQTNQILPARPCHTIVQCSLLHHLLAITEIGPRSLQTAPESLQVLLTYSKELKVCLEHNHLGLSATHESLANLTTLATSLQRLSTLLSTFNPSLTTAAHADKRMTRNCTEIPTTAATTWSARTGVVNTIL